MSVTFRVVSTLRVSVTFAPMCFEEYKSSKKKSDEKVKKTNTIVYFCPECGFELKTSKKSAEEHPGSPTCVCGCKMGIDYGEEPNNEQSEK